MRRRAIEKLWSSVAVLVVPGCFVSFNDYPLAESGGESAAPGGSASSSGGSSSPNAGSGGSGTTSAGSAALGGAAGEGGDGTSTSPSLVDDFEDGNQYIVQRDGRNGAWYVSNDGRGSQTPRAGGMVLPVMLEPPRPESRRGLHTFGGPFPEWGALIGTSLVLNGATSAPYDLSRYSGIAFWVRAGSGSGSGPGGPSGLATSVRVNLPSTQTNGSGNDHFGFDVPLSSEWQRFEKPFAELAQSGFGTAADAPDLEHVTGIQFFVAQDLRFDLWVDDIELY